MVRIIIVLGILFSVGLSAAAESVYTVRAGDTLYAISRQYGISWEELAAQNGIRDPKTLRIGTSLRIPGGSKSELDEDEAHLLARVIHAEARGECLTGQIAVGAVILNRMKSPRFPDTLREVLYQPRQFTPVQQGVLPDEPKDSCLDAARRALAGEDPTNGALFFYNPQKAQTPGFWATRQVLTRIGNHNFTR